MATPQPAAVFTGANARYVLRKDFGKEFGSALAYSAAHLRRLIDRPADENPFPAARYIAGRCAWIPEEVTAWLGREIARGKPRTVPVSAESIAKAKLTRSQTWARKKAAAQRGPTPAGMHAAEVGRRLARA